MSDLVERLRDETRWANLEERKEAADTIESLQAKLEVAREALKEGISDSQDWAKRKAALAILESKP